MTNENQKPEIEVAKSDRREFLKRMIVTGALAAPVVATFARGVRGSQSLQNALNENAASNGQGAHRDALLLNASAQREPQRPGNTTTGGSRTKNAALPTTTTKPPAAKKSTTTTKPSAAKK